MDTPRTRPGGGASVSVFDGKTRGRVAVEVGTQCAICTCAVFLLPNDESEEASPRFGRHGHQSSAKRRCKSLAGRMVGREFVVSTAVVLHECVAGRLRACGADLVSPRIGRSRALSRAWADSIGPPAGHFPVGLVHEPPVAGGAASGPGGDDELLDEDLDQPVDAHGIDVTPRAANNSSTSRSRYSSARGRAPSSARPEHAPAAGEPHRPSTRPHPSRAASPSPARRYRAQSRVDSCPAASAGRSSRTCARR